MKKTNILAQAKPTTITLADGKEYALPPINMTTLANIEETLGYGLGHLEERVQDKTMTTVRDVLWALLKENYPKMTAEQAGKLVPASKIGEIIELVGEIFSSIRG